MINKVFYLLFILQCMGCNSGDGSSERIYQTCQDVFRACEYGQTKMHVDDVIGNLNAPDLRCQTSKAETLLYGDIGDSDLAHLMIQQVYNNFSSLSCNKTLCPDMDNCQIFVESELLLYKYYSRPEAIVSGIIPTKTGLGSTYWFLVIDKDVVACGHWLLPKKPRK